MLDSQRAELTGSIVGNNIDEIDTVNKLITQNGHKKIAIDSVYKTLPDELLVSYVTKKEQAAVYIFIAPSELQGVPRKMFIYWEHGPNKTYG